MSLRRKTRSKSAFGTLFQGLFRRSQIETLEPRVVFNGDALGAKPLWVGGVYVEEDSGSDAHGDSFYVTFEGGVANTRLNRLVIDTDQNATGYSVADNLFDTLEGNRGADHAYGFKVESLETQDPEARVWAEVLDGSMQLVLNFENFYAGDRVVFSIDVDEVQHLYSPVDIQEFNEGLDPITSGAEFEGSMFRAEFSAPHYENSVATGRFFNRYDAQLDQAQQAGSPLDLPADNADGKRDRSSGVAASTPQILIPASIAGKVYLDNNDNGVVDNFEKGLGSVTIELVSSQTITGESIRKLVTTQADGTYRFDSIPPGLYSLFELQPVGHFDGQDSPGRVGDQIRGSLLANDRIGNILLNGGDVGVEYNFGELEPSSISGKVHIGLPGFSCFSADPLGSRPLADVTITLVDNLGKVVAKALTDSLGAYRFDGLPKGLYTIVESQPVGLIDGSSRAGTVEGASNGVAINGTRIESIRLLGGQTAIDYDFCERLPSSISGKVYEDIDQNGAWNSGDSRISGVQIDLLDRDGKLLATTTTQADGSYRFEGLAPGSYTVVERQPEGYFQAGQQPGSAGGNATTVDTISSIVLTDGLDAIDYDFLEIPPGIVSGYVFQDGSELLTSDGQPPGDLTGIRDGVRTPDDLPVAGSVLQLRKLDGSLLSSDDVLPGRYGPAGVEVLTDATGFYRFEGVRPGKYHIFQKTSASNLSDGWDTPGTTGGYAINAGQSVPNDIQETIDLLATEQASDPGTDALLFVQVVARGTSFENNFSEILVGVLPPPPPPPPPPTPPPPPPPPLPPAPPIDPAPLISGPLRADVVRFPSNPAWVVLAPVEELRLPQSIAGFHVDYTWHLSVINAGEPRGYQDRKIVDRDRISKAARMLNATTWTVDAMDSGRWQIVAAMKKPNRVASRRAFSVEGASQLAGDFNGDGTDELALFKDGEWLIDINGNGQWDRSDLWAQLGGVGDLPVVGDWDGDGKDDIGVWGIARAGDGAAIEREPGLPDPENRLDTKPKNLPPEQDEESLVRLMQRGSQGDPRSDVIDHVFRFGTRGDQPIAGDFNGDGISTLGIFQDGRWVLDINGDGQLDPTRDGYSDFGKAGDIAIVGDFNGDGIDEIAIVRGNRVIVDSNGNGKLDVTDRVFEIQGEGQNVVVGDFDGDGIDEAAYYAKRSGTSSQDDDASEGSDDEGYRQARSR